MFKTTPIKAGTRLIVALRAGGVMMVTSMLAGGGGGLVVDREGQHRGLGQKLQVLQVSPHTEEDKDKVILTHS